MVFPVQHTLKHKLRKNTERKTAADRQILFSINDDLFNICLAAEKRFCQKQTDDQKEQIADKN